MKERLTYEDYCRRMNAYETAFRRLGDRVHYLSPAHPVRLHLKRLVADIKALPEELLQEYLSRRHGSSTVES